MHFIKRSTTRIVFLMVSTTKRFDVTSDGLIMVLNQQLVAERDLSCQNAVQHGRRPHGDVTGQ